jgi:pilus assembly protein FimV
MPHKMHNYKRLPMISLGRKVLGVAVASSLLMLSSAQATGLGRLTVLSSLGQPLRAEIELTSPSKDEVASLVPKLASVDAFKQASIDFNPALLSMRFAVEPRGSGYVIRVTSTQAMNEPFVDLLLEMNSSGGKLLREYTFLLDPAQLRNSQSAQVANPISISTGASETLAPVSAPAKTKLAAPTISPNAPPLLSRKKGSARSEGLGNGTESHGEYHVKQGDTLSKIAREFGTDGISLDQMLVGLYKANPLAFSGNNMNRLRSGQILSIPNPEQANVSSVSESHSIVTAHAADFNSYRNKLAGQVADAPAQSVAANKQSVSGTISARVKEVPTATTEALDRLKLSKAAPNAAAKVGVEKGLSEEDKIAKDKTIADANARVKELEKNVGELQKLLEIKSKNLAETQALASAKEDAKKIVSQSAVPANDVSAAASAVVSKTLPTPSAKSDVLVVASTPVKRKILPPPEEPGFIERMLDSSLVLPIGVVAALLAGFGIFSSRRKKKIQQFDDSILTGSSMKANSMFGSTGGQSVDTNNSVFNSNFAPSASQLDANEVDPVAEADVYIAYGRDSQAEEILKEALRTQPDRHAVRVKLLEIYYSRKDPRSFERLASELYGMTSGEGGEWAQATSMGVVLEPSNPLYAGGKAQPDFHSEASLGSSTQPLEDLDPEALLGNSLSQDMLESISIIDTASGLTDDADPVRGVSSQDKSVADIGSLDFDLDIPGSNLEDDVPMLPEESAKSMGLDLEKPTEETPIVDFGAIDFDLGDTDSVVATNVDDAGHDLNAGMAVEKLKVDFEEDANQLAFESESIPESISTPVSDFSLPEVDADIPYGDKLEKPLSEASSEAYEFDLSGIDLDLGSSDVKSESPITTNEESHSYNAEMATKLDLAVAYHEIGDKEGARELLDEVLKGGTPDQVEKAQSMLLQLL